VGGEVKPVQLISSVPPTYPQLARSQRISGDVKIDALIDENGRVTAMKVVSGPVLLHQAAMDSLHQWKYRPASLDGKAVSMHLVVTVQFRLQQ
jgi:protein TonB